MEHQRRLDNGYGLFLVWLNWVLATGAMAFLIIISLYVSPTVTPLIAFMLWIVVSVLIHRNNKSRIPVCYLIPSMTARILLISGIIMMIINYLYTRHIIHHIFDPKTINADIPFITTLIVNPVAVFVSGWIIIRAKKYSSCRNCQLRNGTPAESGFLGKIFSQESTYQAKLFFLITLVISVSAWVYYFLLYINANINKPDRFFFFIVPLLFFLLAAIFTGIRYICVWKYYDQNIEGSTHRHGRSTQLRFIMIWDNYVCLKEPDSNPDSAVDITYQRYDTPASLFIPYRQKMTDYEAEFYFSGMSHMNDVKIRFMYSNVSANADCNIFHYLCFLTTEEKERIESEFKSYKFFSIQQLERMINTGMTEPLLSAEIIRLHTVVMAWKTYHRDGRRRYKIKHYKPTFRLSDAPKWDVDYNDPEWMFISENNEDKMFFKLKRFWRKYILRDVK